MEKNIVVNASNMSELVRTAFQECLFEEGENTTDRIEVEGITRRFGFHPQRLEEHRELLVDLLEQLPTVFRQGYTFLNICMTKDGTQWTGEQSICELLVCMSIGLKLMEYCMPRELWFILPGGVPYVIVK